MEAIGTASGLLAASASKTTSKQYLQDIPEVLFTIR